MTEPVTPAQRATLNAKRLLSILVARIRRVLGMLLQVVERDQLRVLTHETRRLSSASVESVTFLGGELKTLEERLARLEEELAAIRGLLEERGSTAESESEQDEVATQHSPGS
jgi:uncharacterized coiled-coil DUF342 family protein